MQRWRKDGWWICLEIQKIEIGGAVLESKSKMYQRLTKETDAWNSQQRESQSAPKNIRRWSGALQEQWQSRGSHWAKRADETLTDMPAVRRISGRLWQSWKRNTRGRSNVLRHSHFLGRLNALKSRQCSVSHYCKMPKAYSIRYFLFTEKMKFYTQNPCRQPHIYIRLRSQST